ncbi:MAG: hypothetical protein A2277_01930 [Desulfobacterales bacterium RIFOXYA12_FULL_46_15]|nr:MAG: hypothetical protein A2097_02070 [Desulfobacula sp. GWF2_41_7]OGR24303.1 MAG: hypothetical protein A2277_01930 [Desulfobacterales bacterium RIFOXYA12_FULL_46_15]
MKRSESQASPENSSVRRKSAASFSAMILWVMTLFKTKIQIILLQPFSEEIMILFQNLSFY